MGSGLSGRVDVLATYDVLDPATLRLTLEAHTDRATIVNLCHHPYFNLEGGGEIGSHRLIIAAEHYLPSRNDLIPIGEIAPVAGTRFDFRLPRLLGEVPRGSKVPYNHTFCLAEAARAAPHFAARLSARGGVEMEVWTTQDGLHLYEGYKIANCPPGSTGAGMWPAPASASRRRTGPTAPTIHTFPRRSCPPGRRIGRSPNTASELRCG